MNQFKSALVPISIEEFNQDIGQVEKLISISDWMECPTHIYVYGDEKSPLEEQSLATIGRSKGACPVEIHRSRGDLSSEIHNLIQCYAIDIILFTTTRGEPLPISQFKREIIRSTEIAALVVPRKMEGSGIPPSLLVPFSAEHERSSAVDLAIRISNQKHIPIELLHVTRRDESCNCSGLILERYDDQYHREYPRLLEEMVAKASPFTTLSERRCIRIFRHTQGELSDEIDQAMSLIPRAWLILEWKGSWERGKAEIIKRELRRYKYPILIVRTAAQRVSRLKVGENFEAA